ncbi:MAG: Pycsar system effector family protein [Bacteroidota bacterium]
MEIVNKAEDYIKDLYATHPHELLLFHNFNYTTQTVKSSAELAHSEKLEGDELQMVLLAAWFINIGYLFDFVSHIEHSIKVAKEFVSEFNYPDDKAKIVTEAIEVVLKNKPENKIEKVLSDANNSIFASEELLLWVKYHRQERNYFVKPKITRRSFWQSVLNLLNEHEYYTPSAKNLFQEGKSENIEKINLLMAEELNGELPKNNLMVIQDMKAELTKINQKVEKKIASSRGYDSLYRITARNQINLSGIADNKANILITLNALIVSAVITFVFARIDSVNYLAIPALITVSFSLVSIAFAVISTRPHIMPGKFKMKDFYDKKTNLIFYGNFYNMDYDEYDRAVRDMLSDQELLFSNLNRDQYELGKILGRKFKLLHHSYTIFLYGFIISAISFIVTLFSL